MITIAIHQSNFLPYPGFFKMLLSDIFVPLNTVQFVKNEWQWQNRNRIRAPSGWQYLTVPIHHRFLQKIMDVEIVQELPWRKSIYRGAEHAAMCIAGFFSVREWPSNCSPPYPQCFSCFVPNLSILLCSPMDGTAVISTSGEGSSGVPPSSLEPNFLGQPHRYRTPPRTSAHHGHIR